MDGAALRISTVRRARVWIAAAAVVALLAAGSARAATPVGQLFSPTGNCTSSGTFVVIGVASGTSYTVPSNGVITSWSFDEGGTPVPNLKFKVGRAHAGNYTIVAESAAGAQHANQVDAYPVRIPVLAGDVIGLYENLGNCDSPGSVSDSYSFGADDTPPGADTTATGGTGVRFPVAAAVEPDVDGDGFGDETQDNCPAITGSVQGCPKADLSITDVAGSSSVVTGTNVTYTLTGTNNGPDPAPGVVLTDVLPSGSGAGGSGATLVSASPSTGSCAGTTTVTCKVGTLASGATATVTLVVRMTESGTQQAGISSASLITAAQNASGAGDTNPANDHASAETTVFAAPYIPPQPFPLAPQPFVPVSNQLFGASFSTKTVTVRNGVAYVDVTSDIGGAGALALTVRQNTQTGNVTATAKKKKKSKFKTITLGKASFTATAGKTQTIKVKLSKQALALLSKRGTLNTLGTANVTEAFGASHTTKATLKLKPAKAKKKPKHG